MADLRLQVIMTALDKVTGPLKKIRGAATPTSQALKATSDRLKELNKQQGAAGKFRELHAGLSTTSDKLKAAQTKVNDLAKEIKATANPTKEMTRNFESAKNAAKKLQAQFSSDRIKLQGLRDEMAKAGIQTGALRGAIANAGNSSANFARHQRQLRTDIAATTARMEQQKNQLVAVARQQERMAKVRAKFDKSRDFAGKAATVGATSGMLGGGILMGARKTLMPGVDFDAAMSRVQALSRLDKESADFKQLRQQARDLGANTSFTATEAAQGQGYLAMAGFKPEAILQSMPTMLSVAKAGGTDLARTADISSDILTSFGLEADQMGRVGDVLTMTFTTANTNLEMLGDTMKYVGPIAKAAGMSLEQASAMAGLLGNAGIKSSQAGTTLRSMTLRLAAPTGKAAKALNELGIASRDLKGDVRDIPGILRDVAVATNNIGSGERLDFIKKIFGEEPAAGMAQLIETQGVEGIEQYVAIIKNSQGIADKTARIMDDNLLGDMLKLKSAWQDVGLTLNDSLNKPLRTLTTRITDVLGAVSMWMQNNPELSATVLKVALGVGALLAVMGTLTLALATIVVPIAALKMAFGIIAIKGGLLIPILRGIGSAVVWLGRMLLIAGRALLMHPIGLTITAIATAVFLIYRYWTPIKAFFSALWDGVTASFNRAWDGISTFAGGVWADLKTVFSDGILSVGALILNWSPLGLFYRAFAGVMDWFGVDLPAKFTDFGSNIMHGLVDGIVRGVQWVVSTMKTVADKVSGVFTQQTEINSPSRLFARYGDYTMQGLANGLQRSEDAPIAQVSSMAKRLSQLGAGIAIGAAAMPAMAFDTRPPMTARAASSGVIVQGDTIQITIQSAPGMDANTIAQAVAKALDQRDRQKAARLRSSLHDYD
ncbi:phage tail tape measure protein [Glaciimonas sp. GG7]